MSTRKLIIGFAAILALSAGVDSMARAADVGTEPPAFSWDGFYLGVHGGYGWAKSGDGGGCENITDLRGEGGGPFYDNLCDAADAGATDWSYIDDSNSPHDGWWVEALNLDGDVIALIDQVSGGDTDGFMGGGQLGINKQYGNVVVGLEADISAMFMGDSNSSFEFESFQESNWYWNNGWWNDNLNVYDGIGVVSNTSEMDWLATFRGRLGFAMGSEGRFLPYVTGGAALAHINNSSSANFDDSNASEDWCESCDFTGSGGGNFYQPGLAIGIGGEYAFTDNVTFGLEYLYVHLYGKQENTVTFHQDDGRSFDVRQEAGFDNVQTISAKLNFLLN